jgi:flagellar motor protein MotB
MMLCRVYSIAALCSLIFLAGCNNNPFAQTQPFGTSSPMGMSASASPAATVSSTEIADLERRVRALDENNRMLTAQLAQVQQQGDLYKERSALLQKQLGDMTAQVQSSMPGSSRVASAPSTPQPRGIQASASVKTGATLTANNSLAKLAGTINIPGTVTEVDGDTIRIRIPADQIFASGTDQLNGSASNILDPAANAIASMFPKQRVGIEGHADDGPLYGGNYSSPLQLSTAQAMQVVDYLTKRNQLAPNQLFTIGHGTNHPRASNQSAIGRAENRRIEIVIYPTTY